jgi:hypothetical protein
VVWHVIGYDRLETGAEWLLLKAIYADLRLYVNFFQPVLKLIGKDRVGEKVIKRYDTVTTPYQRVLDTPLSVRSPKFTYVSIMPNSIQSL